MDEDKLIDSFDSLYLLVEKLPTGKEEKRAELVSTLSKYLDIGNATVIVKICSIILKVCSNGSHILQTCKILFKISKQEKYDKLFKDDKIILPLVHLLYQEFTTENYNISWEILLFAIGTLKNISYDSRNQKVLVKHNTVSLLSLLLSSAMRELKTGNMEKVNKQAQLLVQIMATLRNLAMRSSTFPQFLEYNVIDNIQILMSALMSHSEFIHNTTRVLSKLSLDETCTVEMRNIHNLKTCLINVLREHRKHKPIVERLTFILGNITFQDYNAQEKFEDSEVVFLLELLDLYTNEDERDKSENVKKETEDLLTKLIRLIANISMDETQGKLIAQSKQCNRLLELVERKKVVQSEELILNALRCVTNLSFYSFLLPESPLVVQKLKISSLLSPMLFHDNSDLVYEATRTFGNLSQDEQVREYMNKARIDEALVILIDHANIDIVFAVCGVLVNLASDSGGVHLALMRDSGAIEKLLDLLERSSVSLALIILKIFHNICLNVSTDSVFSEDEIDHMDSLLTDILTQGYDSEEMSEQDLTMVGDMVDVAQQLQQIILQ